MPNVQFAHIKADFPVYNDAGTTSFTWDVANKINFDEWLGENICSECGLVEITEPFEQTVSFFSKEGDVIRSVDVPKKIGTGDYPNHIRVGLTYCNVLI